MGISRLSLLIKMAENIKNLSYGREIVLRIMWRKPCNHVLPEIIMFASNNMPQYFEISSHRTWTDVGLLEVAPPFAKDSGNKSCGSSSRSKSLSVRKAHVKCQLCGLSYIDIRDLPVLAAVIHDQGFLLCVQTTTITWIARSASSGSCLGGSGGWNGSCLMPSFARTVWKWPGWRGVGYPPVQI